MPHLPRVPAFPIAGERSIITAAGAALKIPAKEKHSPLIGSLAPEIYAKDHLGRHVSLHATIELGRPIVLYFFPLAGSPHCTRESCSFRDAVGTSPIFNDLNAVVIGISQDPPARSKRFVDEHHLGFRILHDSNREIMDAWGVGRGLLGLIDGRCTFVIDHEGIVRAMLDGVWDYKGHRDFAEKWLCRIEHELSGRERFYVEHDADDSVACDEISRNVKVMYGEAVPARGIATAPRHGAAPSATKLKGSSHAFKQFDPTKSASLSLAAEANGAGSSIAKPKSRRNLKSWLRPADSFNGVYDEPLHVDYKHGSHSLDEANRAPTRHSRLPDGAQSADKIASRVQSMRLDESSSSSSDHAPVAVRDFAEADPSSRHGSGSGSGWATPSTISARSVSTGETSHASPGPESHAIKLSAAISSGIAAQHYELERSGSSSRRRHEGANAVAAVPRGRTSSLNNKRASAEPVPVAGEASALGAATSLASTVYANGNIAKMPLHPAVNGGGEASLDSLLAGQDRRIRLGQRAVEASADSEFLAGTSSLPVPPRRGAKSGAGAGAGTAAVVPARVRQPSEASASSDGYETDRGAPAKRVLPPQPSAPAFAPPPIPSSISPSMPSTSSFRRHGHPSPSFGSLQNGFFTDDVTRHMERRASNTPSLTPSSLYDGSVAASELDAYSPSLAGSTHTFGGEEEHAW